MHFRERRRLHEDDLDLYFSGGDLLSSGRDLTGSGGDLLGSGGDLLGSGEDLSEDDERIERNDLARLPSLSTLFVTPLPGTIPNNLRKAGMKEYHFV